MAAKIAVVDMAQFTLIATT
jgi:hypothetical protein